MTRTRRQFLAETVAGSAVISMTGAVPGFLRATAAAEGAAGRRSDRILVVVQLSGGNDGLNTVVPYKDDLYFRRRPSIALDPRQVRKLDDALALHPAMGGLAKLFEDRRLTVIEGVGYPNPSRSHFVSMDIWHSARPEKPDKRSGWLGRSLAAARSDADAGKVRALSLGGKELPPALVADGVEVPAVEDLRDFQLRLEGGSSGDQSARRRLLAELTDRSGAGNAGATGPLAFVSDTMRTTYAAAEALAEVTAKSADRVRYPDGPLGRSLRGVAQVIAAGFGTRIFYTSLGGFDTHAKQIPAHAQLMAQVSDSIKAFWDDIRAQGRENDVLLMTFSEFGRRVEQNASHGTDHGTAAPMFLVSGRTPGGIVGRPPSLTDLMDGGDLKHQFDFRAVYATVLEKWLGADPAAVLGGRFDPLPIVSA